MDIESLKIIRIIEGRITEKRCAVFQILKKSESAVVILHEIYGINDFIKTAGERYAAMGFDVYCPDLLSGKVYGYPQQREAYENFQKNVGFDRSKISVTSLLRELRPKYKKLALVGFSVGATTAFGCSESGLCDILIGFYGSRIRDYLAVSPKCPSLLIFASQDSFDVEKTASALSEKNNVTVKILDAGHGFCDPFGPNYHAACAEQAKALSDSSILRCL